MVAKWWIQRTGLSSHISVTTATQANVSANKTKKKKTKSSIIHSRRRHRHHHTKTNERYLFCPLATFMPFFFISSLCLFAGTKSETLHFRIYIYCFGPIQLPTWTALLGRLINWCTRICCWMLCHRARTHSTCQRNTFLWFRLLEIGSHCKTTVSPHSLF